MNKKLNLIACGINHQTAPVHVRERVAFDSSSLSESLFDLVHATHADEAVILSTCNRTEFYCINSEAQRIYDWLHVHKRLSAWNLRPYCYAYTDEAALQHLLRVTSGLDSMVLGEAQIVGQVKAAFTLAHSAGTVGTQFLRLFQYLFSACKTVRQETNLSKHPVSMSFAVSHLLKHIFTTIHDKGVLLIGAGETVTRIAKHLKTLGVQRFWIANRTAERAASLAETIDATIITLPMIPQYLAYADIIITATASILPILGKGMVESALKKRKHRPFFMADLAVPRDIEPEVAQLEAVYLYTLDDLQRILADNLHNRVVALAHAEAMIQAKVNDYFTLLRTWEAAPLIRAYRQKATHICDNELRKALRLLQLSVPAPQVLQRFARSLTNKLLHTPSVELRRAACSSQKDLLECAVQLFGLSDEFER